MEWIRYLKVKETFFIFCLTTLKDFLNKK